MSIYVSITRRSDPLADEGPSISAEEWLAVVDADPELRQPAEEELESALLGDDDIPAVWFHPDGHTTWFVLTDGNVEVKNPDAALLHKMATVADTLDAHLISETGERFDSSGQSLGFKSDDEDAEFDEQPKPVGLWGRIVRWFR